MFKSWTKHSSYVFIIVKNKIIKKKTFEHINSIFFWALKNLVFYDNLIKYQTDLNLEKLFNQTLFKIVICLHWFIIKILIKINWIIIFVCIANLKIINLINEVILQYPITIDLYI